MGIISTNIFDIDGDHGMLLQPKNTSQL
jgi:hypothetical protein